METDDGEQSGRLPVANEYAGSPPLADAQSADAPGPRSPSLDFLSPTFDPLRALHAPDLQPPVPSARPLDNVAMCRRLMPPEVAAPLEAPKPNEESRKKHLRFKESAIRARERIMSSVNFSLDNVIAAALAASPGPMDALRRWHAAGARVSVTTRHASGFRGCATGVLAAFDRFMNLVLQNVTERYTVPVRFVKEYKRLVPAAAVTGGASARQCTGLRREVVALGQTAAAANVASGSRISAGGGGSSGTDGVAANPPGPEAAAAGSVPEGLVEVTRTRVVRLREERQRQLGQIFIKGDNIISVYSADEQEDWAGGGSGAQGMQPAAGLAAEPVNPWQYGAVAGWLLSGWAQGGRRPGPGPA